MKIGIAFLFLGALAQDDPLVASALRGYHHPWAGFREGSAVTYRETSRRPEVDGNGNLVLKEVVSQMVWSVASTDGDKATLRIQGEGQDSEVLHHFALPNWTQGKGERRAEEDLVVGATRYPCKVTAIVIDADKDASEVTTIWQNPLAPGWAVKVRNETFMRGKINTSEETLLIGVREEVKVGDRDVPCRVVQVTTEVDSGGRVVKKEWRADEVPGGVVRRETRHYQRGREIEAAFTQMEVVRFSGRK
jgi:hypothetical protein